MIKRIGHLALVVADMEKSLHFYCDVLGFEKAFELRNKDGDPWIEYVKVCDGQFIELFHGGQNHAEPVKHQIGPHHFCLEVEDIYAIADHIKSKGIELDEEPKRGLDNNDQCWVRDPDGNRIEFMQIHPDSPHKRS